jgi:hypothetical protein
MAAHAICPRWLISACVHACELIWRFVSGVRGLHVYDDYCKASQLVKICPIDQQTSGKRGHLHALTFQSDDVMLVATGTAKEPVGHPL